MDDAEKCQEIATIRRFWPGESPDLICVDHAQDSERIAEAIGFKLHLEPISYPVAGPIVTEFPTCCCNAALGSEDFDPDPSCPHNRSY